MTQSISNIVRRGAIVCAILAALPAAASAQLNGIVVSERVFNDFSTTALLTSNNNANPGNVTITETAFADDNAGGNFANRHDVKFSADGGATAASLAITTPFTVSTIVNLGTVSNAPRKEAGLRIFSPVTGDAVLIVNSDAGEIVSFGGGAPFKLFGKNSDGNGYTPGTPLFMGMTYTPGSGVNPGTVEYFINRTAANGMGAGLETSGALPWSNLEGGPVNFSIGAYVQSTPNLNLIAAPEAVTASFTNLTAVIPEPTSLAALSLGAALLRRRRTTAC